MDEIQTFYLNQEEPVRAYLLAMRLFILAFDREINEAWKYGMPFFTFRKKMFCYLWIHKKTGWPYIGFVEGKYLHHPQLLSENRSRMKTMLLDPEKDIPVSTLHSLLRDALMLYTSGTIKLPANK